MHPSVQWKEALFSIRSSRSDIAFMVSPSAKKNSGICDAYNYHWRNNICSSLRKYATQDQEELISKHVLIIDIY